METVDWTGAPEGLIQYRTEYLGNIPPTWIQSWEEQLREFLHVRNLAHSQKLLGMDTQGIAYGNWSMRLPDGSIVITASQTSHLPEISLHQICRIPEYDLDEFSLCWQGSPDFPPSSETLSHLGLYHGCGEITCILHTHHEQWFQRWMKHPDFPGTDSHALPGTPLLACELQMVAWTRLYKLPTAIGLRGHPPGWMLVFPSLASAESWLSLPEPALSWFSIS